MKAQRLFFDSKFGYVFTYEGQDTRGNYHTAYSVLAHTPEELYEAMKSWRTYGRDHELTISPNDNFRKHISAIFSIEDGTWEDRDSVVIGFGKREKTCTRYIKGQYNQLVRVRTYGLKTTGCGAWGINVCPAFAPTLEEHKAIVKAEQEADKAERIRIANERTAKAREEFNVVRKGWYYVELEVVALNLNMRRVYKTFSGNTIADSKMDAYLKAATKECQDMCAEMGLIFESCGEWNSGTTRVEFLGMKTDYGYSVDAWEEYQKSKIQQ